MIFQQTIIHGASLEAKPNISCKLSLDLTAETMKIVLRRLPVLP